MIPNAVGEAMGARPAQMVLAEVLVIPEQRPKRIESGRLIASPFRDKPDKRTEPRVTMPEKLGPD
jgi:hypothetical protein